MASQRQVILFLLPLVIIYLRFAVSTEIKLQLGDHCNTTTQCTDGNAMCSGKCVANDSREIPVGGICNATTLCKANDICSYTYVCKYAFYKDSYSGCKPHIHHNQRCGNLTIKNESCVAGAYCNAKDVCVCGFNYIPTSGQDACYESTVKIKVSTQESKSHSTETSHTVSSLHRVQTTSPKSTTDDNSTPPDKSGTTIVEMKIPIIALCFMVVCVIVAK